MKHINKNPRFLRFLSAPTFEDDEKSRIAHLVNSILRVIASGATLFLVTSGLSKEAGHMIFILALVMLAITVGLKLLLNQGYVRLVGSLLSLAIWTCFTVPVVMFDGLRDTAVSGYFLAVAITSLVVGGKTLLVFMLLASLSLTATYLAELNDLLTTSFSFNPSPMDLIAVLVSLNITAGITYSTVRRLTRSERSITVERDKAQLYLDIAGTIIVALDTHQNITLVNKRGCQVLGYQEAEVIGKNWMDTFLPARIRDQIKTYFDRLIAGEIEGLQQYENPVVTKSGQERVIAWSNTLLKDEAGHIIGTLGSGEDMTERILAARQVEERQQYLEGVLRATPDAIITLDAHHCIVEWNPGAERLFGYTETEVIGQTLDDLVTNPYLLEEAVGFTHRVMDGDDILALETIRYRKDGSPVDVILAGSPIRVEDQMAGAVAVYIDISERKRMERQLSHIATHDPLTDLPNRLLFNDRLKMTLDLARINQNKVVLMMLDLDRFKEVNDTLGHDAGDILLQAVGDRLKHLLRQSDTVARMGGDEFVLILPNVMAAENADSIAEKLITGFQKPFNIENQEIIVTLSIGIAIYPDDGDNGKTLMKNADIAMYQSKQRGRNQYQHFTPPDSDFNMEGL